MKADQFDLIAKLLRSRDPVREAARLVLIDGKTNTEAMEETGVSASSVSNTLARFRSTHEAIKNVYKGKK